MNRTIPFSVIAALIAGCGGEIPAEAPATEQAALITSFTTGSSRVVLARVTTTAGSKVEFIQGAEDELGVSIDSVVGALDRELDQARASQDNIVDFYEALTGQPAPRALVDAQADANQARYLEAPDDGTERAGSSSDELVAPKKPVASNPLCSIYNYASPASGPFRFCFTEVSGTPWYQDKVDHASCRVDALNGSVQAGYRYKTGTGWHDDVVTINAGHSETWIHWYRFARRWRHCRVLSNPAHHLLNFRVVGHQFLGGNVFFVGPYVTFPEP